MGRSRRAANYGRKIGAQARNARERAAEKKREQAPAPVVNEREDPYTRLRRRIDEANRQK